MLPLIPIAVSLLPELARWLIPGSPTAERTASAVAAVVAQIAGTSDPVEAAAAMARDPAAATTLRVRLAEIAAEADAATRAAELETLRAQLADVASARGQTVALAQAASPVQWAPVLVSLLVLGTFGVVMYAALTSALPAGSETILNMLLGTLAAMATSVVSYWVGSSAGSAQKTEMLARQGVGR